MKEKIMSENTPLNRLYVNLVHQRHDELRAAGKNPDLAAVARDIQVRLTPAH